MRFPIAIHGAPFSHQGAQSAYRFALATLAAGHRIGRIFFYQDGVHNGNRLITPAQDELNLPDCWQTLAEQHEIELVVCIAAAARRGVLDQREAARHQHPAANLAPGFTLSGLGQWIDALAESDRFIAFGP